MWNIECLFLSIVRGIIKIFPPNIKKDIDIFTNMC